MTRSLAAALCAAALFAGCERPRVVRSAAGELVLGRFIAPQAYEAYARATLAEAEGRLPQAADAFRAAAVLDPDGPEPWTRLGAVLCLQDDPRAADEAFAAALEADPSFAPAYKERARCALGRRDAAGALAAAELALVLDPEDEDTALVYADALAEGGRVGDARSVLVALLVRGPPRAGVAERLMKLATAEDVASRRLAARATALASARPAARTVEDVDRALLAGDLTAARALAASAGVAPGALALRAAALGATALAAEQARLVGGADPGDGDAAAAALIAGPPAGGALASGAPAQRSLSPFAKLLLLEAVARAIGAEAARPLVGSADLDVTRKDALEERVRVRLKARLGAP